jgi:hypothetical protein
MIAGSITLSPNPPAFFAFVLGADGGWNPRMLSVNATYRSLGRCSSAGVVIGGGGYQCGGYLACRCGDHSYSFAPQLLGVEEGLMGWLVAQGYGAEAESVRLDGYDIRVVRVTW